MKDHGLQPNKAMKLSAAFCGRSLSPSRWAARELADLWRI
jgi:hypothetical protein